MHSDIRRTFHWGLVVIIVTVTVLLSEASFRMYDFFTAPHKDVDAWVRNISHELEQHPRLGYRYPPFKILNERERADEFGMRNAVEAYRRNGAEVVGVGDSY